MHAPGYFLAHKMAQRLTQVRKGGAGGLPPSRRQTQVTVEYDENNQPVRVDTVVLSTSTAPRQSWIRSCK